jgi:5-methylcytosine-specific restriction endonuclease McrA
MFKPSGNPKVLELTKSIRERSYNLSCLKPIKLEELNDKGKPRRLCAWCAVEEIFGGNQKYCSNNCSTSAMAWSYPQKEDALRYLLLRQDWKCAHCAYDYMPFLEKIVERDRERNRSCAVTCFLDFATLPWYYFKRLKAKVPGDRKPEVDHVLAISKGGHSLGLENHQVLCYTCHKIKSKIDNSGKRIKKVDI